MLTDLWLRIPSFEHRGFAAYPLGHQGVTLGFGADVNFIPGEFVGVTISLCGMTYTVQWEAGF